MATALYAIAASPWGLAFTDAFASRMAWLPRVAQRPRGDWLSGGLMTPIAVGGEGSFGALVRSALGEAAGAGFGGYFRVPLPWLALAIVHVLVWWCVVRLVARRNGIRLDRGVGSGWNTGWGAMGLAAMVAVPIPAMFKCARMMWAQVSGLTSEPLNSFGAGDVGLVCLFAGAVLLYVGTLRYIAGVVASGIGAASGLCAACAYARGGLDRCPECGRTAAEAMRRAGRRRIVILGVGLLASMVLLISPLWLSWGASLAGV